MSRDVAARALEESPTAGKRIVVVSAFTVGSLRLDAPPPTIRVPGDKRVRPEMVIRDVARGRKVLPNHFLADLRAEVDKELPSRFARLREVVDAGDTADADVDLHKVVVVDHGRAA